MAVVDDERGILGTWGLYPGTPAGRPMVVTYSFPAADPRLPAGFVPATETIKTLARNAMASVAAVSGLVFIETTTHVGDIAFGQYDFGPGSGTLQSGSSNPPNSATQPDAAGAPHVIRGFFPESNDERPLGAGVVLSSINPAPGMPADHVFLRLLLWALGLKWAYFGEPRLESWMVNADITIMSDRAPFLAELGGLDKIALQRLYGPAGSDAWQTDWSWDAASETMTQTAARDGVFVRGTHARDVIHVTARNAIVVAEQGDDIIEAAGQSLEIDAGPGDDTVSTGLTYTINTQVLSIDALGYAIEAPGVRQIVTRAERILFTNGVYNRAAWRFEGELNLGVPAFVRWLDYHTDPNMTGLRGTISLAGPPGLTLEAYLNPQELATGYPVDTTADGRGVSVTPPFAPYTPDAVMLAPLWVDAHSVVNGVRTQKVLVAMYRTGTFGADSIDASADPAAMIYANSGNDSIVGSPGDDLIRGGLGTDTVAYAGPAAAYRLGASGSILRVSGPQGDDILTDVEWLDFADTGPVSLDSLRADGRVEELMAVTRTNPQEPYAEIGMATRVGFELPRAYLGPVGWLEREFVGSLDRETVLGTARAEFIALLAGDDAMSAAGGDDVLDGGLGSNFLTGGAGRDIFFLDGRGGGATWSTVTDWEAGEELALWGWRPGVSQVSWSESDGAAGWQGATLFADLDGIGGADAVVTWTGRTRAELPDGVGSVGLLWFA